MKRTEPVGILDGRMITATWDVTPAPGAVVGDLGHGVTVVLRDPPTPRAGLPAGRVWIAPYALNCAEHGWRVSRRTAEECAAEGRGHIARDHAPAAVAQIPDSEERTRVLRSIVAAGMARIVVTEDGRLCAGGQEPVTRGAEAAEDTRGRIYCLAHIPAVVPAGRPAETCRCNGCRYCDPCCCTAVRPAGRAPLGTTDG